MHHLKTIKTQDPPSIPNHTQILTTWWKYHNLQEEASDLALVSAFLPLKGTHSIMATRMPWGSKSVSFFFFFSFFIFLGLHLQHMEVPRLGAESELRLPAYATVTAMPDPSRVCELHHSSQQCRIHKPLSKARDQTFFLMDASQICFH